MAKLNRASRRHHLPSLIMSAICGFPLAATADIRLGGEGFTVNGQHVPSGAGGYEYTGPCPVDLRFGWGIVSSDSADVVYRFTRSDGARARYPMQRTLVGGGRSTSFTETWSQLGANIDQFANYHAWVALSIEAPYPINYPVSFILHCVEGGAGAGAATDMGSAATDGDMVRASDPPPPLPEYYQPPCPEDGYLWTPGYWSYGVGGYSWVPGIWVAPPRAGLLWTPGYWSFVGGTYAWHAGYWGPRIGFYGGVNYGFGYPGHGFAGGRWAGNHFEYNSAVVNVDTTIIHNTYRENVTVNNITVNRTSFSGGPRGIIARPTPAEWLALHDQHTKPVAAQLSHLAQASHNLTLSTKADGAHPPVPATAGAGALPRAGPAPVVMTRPMPTPPTHALERPQVSQSSRPAPTHPVSPPPPTHPVTPFATPAALHAASSAPHPVAPTVHAAAQPVHAALPVHASTTVK